MGGFPFVGGGRPSWALGHQPWWGRCSHGGGWFVGDVARMWAVKRRSGRGVTDFGWADGLCLWAVFVCGRFSSVDGFRLGRVALVGAFRLRVVVGQGSGSVFTVGGMFGDGVAGFRLWAVIVVRGR